MKDIPNKLRNYIFFVLLLAIVVLVFLFNNFELERWHIIIIFGLLAAVAETFCIQLPNHGAVSVSFAISLAAIIVGSPLTAALVDAIGVLLRMPYVEGRGRAHLLNEPIYKTVFNVSQNIVNAGIAGTVYYLSSLYFASSTYINPIPIILAIIVYMSLNTSFMAQLMSIFTGKKFIRAWIKNLQGTVVSSIAVSCLGIIMALAYKSYGFGAVILFFIPLMLARYSFKLYIDMRKNYLDTIKALVKAIEAKDPYTSGHAARVSEYAVAISECLNLPEVKIERIRTAALLHDIGKIGVDDSILKKCEDLNDLEYNAIKNHPAIGADIIKDVGFLKDAMDIVRHHHERYDGSGYPDGLKGDEIPLEAYVLMLADSFDAMTTDRPYRKAMTRDEAVKEIMRNSGTQFDPEIVEKSAFVLEVIKDKGDVA